jgi:ABC-2 type transport system ATP-binding protein
MNTGNCAIQCKGLTKEFGRKPAVRNVDLQVERGSITALVGPNGAGKTSLLKILAGLLLPTSGQALICGRDVATDPRGTKRTPGFIPSEERSFYWRLTGRQNLRFFAALHGLAGPATEDRIQTLLKSVALDQAGDQSFRYYSTGMKQSLGIARGLLHSPAVLLMDEPTRSLSPDISDAVQQLILALARSENRSVLIASHNLVEVELLADRIAILHQGEISNNLLVLGLWALVGLPLSIICFRLALRRTRVLGTMGHY